MQLNLVSPVLTLLSVIVIQGCSTLGVGESDYACDNPGKGVCKSNGTDLSFLPLVLLEPARLCSWVLQSFMRLWTLLNRSWL